MAGAHPFLADAVDEAVFITDLDGRILYANEAFERIIGYTSAEFTVTQEDSPFLHRDDAARVARFIGEFLDGGAEVSAPLESRFVDRRGDTQWYRSVVRRVRFQDRDALKFVTRRMDAAEQRRARRELHGGEPLNGLALAGGLAQDLDTSLAVLRTKSALAEAAECEGRPVKPFLQEIQKACAKASGLCARLLAVSTKVPTRRTRVDLGAAVEEIASLVRANIRRPDTIVRTEPRIFVSGDVASLQPLVLNLVTNAAEAIGDGPGRIEIDVGVVEHTVESLARLEPGGSLSPGPAGFIRVKDDGIGMTPCARARMFEPFFTTKTAGRGLGLSSVLGTVRANGGAIGVQSAMGSGTTVTVYFPLALPDRAAESRVTEAEGTRPVVLVADDEPALRRSLLLMLASSGFATLEAADGVEAVDHVRRRDDVSVVLLDASMPVMGGIEAAREIRCLRAGVPIVMMSGHAQEPLVGIEMISKPFEPDALVALLRHVIEEA